MLGMSNRTGAAAYAAKLMADLGADVYTNRTDTDRKTRNHIRQLQALGFTVTLTPAA